MVRTGRQYTALEFLEMGLIDQVVDTGEGVDAVLKLARSASINSARMRR